MTLTEEQEAIIRDKDLAWELFEAQPDHPQIEILARSVIAREPSFTGMLVLIADHYVAVGRVDEAREILQKLLAERDRQYANAARKLRDLEYGAGNYAVSAQHAEFVLREHPSAHWGDLFDLGRALTFAASVDDGLAIIAQAVEMAADDSPEDLSDALTQQASHLFESGAPAHVLIPAVEKALRADPSQTLLAIILGFAYVYEVRPHEAEQQFARVLSEYPTLGAAVQGMTIARIFMTPVEGVDDPVAYVGEFKLGEWAWRYIFEAMNACDVSAALAELDPVLPAEFADSFNAPANEPTHDADINVYHDMNQWRDGQTRATAGLWHDTIAYRLLSLAEAGNYRDADEGGDAQVLEKMWRGDDVPYLSVVFTDDDANYIYVGAGGTVVHRQIVDGAGIDTPIAPSLASFIWDRVVVLGGRDGRPRTASFEVAA